MRALVLAALLGLGSGAIAGSIQGVPAALAGSCSVEPQMNLGPGNDTVLDSDDGVDEDNMWFGQGGGDTLRSLACDDRLVSGGNGEDDVGGGRRRIPSKAEMRTISSTVARGTTSSTATRGTTMSSMMSPETSMWPAVKAATTSSTCRTATGWTTQAVTAVRTMCAGPTQAM